MNTSESEFILCGFAFNELCFNKYIYIYIQHNTHRVQAKKKNNTQRVLGYK